MKTFIIFLGLFIAFVASAQKVLKADSVYLTGKVSNLDAAQVNSINVIVNDLSFGRPVQYPGKINKDGTYRLVFLKTGAQDITLKFNDDQAILLVKPGDHLRIDFDAKQFGKSLVFNGDEAAANKDLLVYNVERFADAELGYQGKRYGRYHRLDSSITVDYPDAYKRFLKDRYDRETVFLDRFIQKHQPNNFFADWATTDLKYEYLNNLMRYPLLHNQMSETRIEASATYYDFVKEADVNDVDGSISSHFTAYLYMYGRQFTLKNFATYFTIADKLRIYAQQPPGFARDIMVSQHFCILIDEGLMNKLTPYIDQYKAMIGQPAIRDEIVKAYNDKLYRFNNYALSSNSRINQLPKTEGADFFNKLVAKYPGKVIYVDFWATWCSPCLEEMPSSKVLHNKLANKGVVFVYLAVQSEEKLWKATIANLGIEGEHFLLTKDEYNELVEKFRLSAIPRYILVDKNGRVFDDNAKRPSDNMLKQDIEKLLAAK
ncbi:MAG TPA: TlpA disulfide reductase family protein [Mucilaginibacter sp.]|jgi:Thiol-disulfide isomerase and thioredoxins